MALDGRLDGFFELGLQEWDMAAGTLLITEAGGLVGDVAGGHSHLQRGNIVAGNGCHNFEPYALKNDFAARFVGLVVAEDEAGGDAQTRGRLPWAVYILDSALAAARASTVSKRPGCSRAVRGPRDARQLRELRQPTTDVVTFGIT